MRWYAAAYAVLMGVGMLGMWTVFFISGAVPEVRTAPIALSFHLAAEVSTAALMLVSGIGLFAGASWARTLFLFAAGMLTYTLIVSPGYFAQLGQAVLVAMFAAFLLAGIPALIAVVRLRYA